MKSVWIVALSLFVVTGCGSDHASAPQKKDDATARQTAQVPEIPVASPPEPRASTPSGPPARSSEPSPVAASAAPEKTGAPPGKKVLDEFSPEVIGGRTIRKWVEMLDSKNKDEVIEAINALEFAPTKAVGALPKLAELARSTDADIAREANDAVKKITPK